MTSLRLSDDDGSGRVFLLGSQRSRVTRFEASEERAVVYLETGIAVPCEWNARGRLVFIPAQAWHA